ncbi:MAG: ABC transporter permease [Thermodesulfobacteriota bacterium]
MDFFADSIFSALLLIAGFDRELMAIVLVSLRVSAAAVCLAAVMGIPVGFVIAVNEFWGRRAVITVLNTLLALPTVVVGLFVYAFISRRGIFGPLDLLYTPGAIIVGQMILVLPIIATFTISAVSRIDSRYRKTALTLGASPFLTGMVILREARFGIMAAVIGAFGRAISEVGISMMLGGNIKGFTRTMTTAMALEYDKGAFTLAIALGIVLLTVSLLVNALLNYFQGRVSG